MAEEKKEQEELVRYRNSTEVDQIIYNHEGKRVKLIASPVKGTVLLPKSVANKYRQVLEPVD